MDRLVLYDNHRHKLLKASPEELIRQKVVQKLIEELGFPKHLIAVEKSLHECVEPSLIAKHSIPKRRLDIVCFDHLHLRPFLVIECKAITLNEKAKRQLIGYNQFLKAPFIALASQKELQLGVYIEGAWHFQSGLASYEQLITLI